jgi:autotransporter translocation and assembly factor TamB
METLYGRLGGLSHRGQERLAGEIRLGADGSLQGELASTPMDLARSGTLARSDLTGRARFRLQFQGTLRDTRTLGQAEISALIFQGTPFGPGSAIFTLDHKAVTLDLTVQKGAERLQAVFSPPPNRTIRATLLLRDAELAPVFRLADMQITPSWQARGSGRIVFQGPAKDLAASQGTVSLDSLHLRFGEDLWESRGPVQGTFSRQALTLQPLRLAAANAEVEIRGTAGEGNVNDVAVAGRVPLVLLGQWLPVARPTAGIADVNLRLRGALSAPEVQGSVRVQGGRVTLLRLPQEFQDVRTTLALQN